MGAGNYVSQNYPMMQLASLSLIYFVFFKNRAYHISRVGGIERSQYYFRTEAG